MESKKTKIKLPPNWHSQPKPALIFALSCGKAVASCDSSGPWLVQREHEQSIIAAKSLSTQLRNTRIRVFFTS
jgi:hypothetical protein